MDSKLKIFDIEVSNKSSKEHLDNARRILCDDAGKLTFACANPHSLVVSRKDDMFKLALQSTDILVADGVGVVLVGRLFKKCDVERITGFKMYSMMMELLNEMCGSVFFFGSSNKVLSIIRNNVSKHYPNVQIVGTLSPPFGDWSNEENSKMISEINKVKPDILWVGMTAPKQEKWVYENLDILNARIIGSIGAVFDFYAETKPRAPNWMCKLGLEWMHRFYKEPRRMWRRTVLSAPKFIALVVRESFWK